MGLATSLSCARALTCVLVAALAALIAAPPHPAAADTPFHSKWVAQSPYPRIALGEIGTVSVTFRNTGTATWVKASATEAHLGINGDERRIYQIGMAVDWPIPDRPAFQSEPIVPPGSNASFAFKLRGAAPGVFELHLRPVIEGITWMEDEGVFLYITVESASLHSKWVGQSPYPTIAVNETTTASVTFRNVGTATWRKGTPTEARVGLYGDDRTIYGSGMAVDWVLPDRPATQSEAEVKQGGTATFTFRLKGVTPGTYQLHLRPVIDGIAWMEDEGIFLYVTVREQAAPPLIFAPPASLAATAGQRFQRSLCDPEPVDICIGGKDPSGGKPPYVFTIAIEDYPNTAPFDLTLSSSGVWSGTYPTYVSGATFYPNVCVTDARGMKACARITFVVATYTPRAPDTTGGGTTGGITVRRGAPATSTCSPTTSTGRVEVSSPTGAAYMTTDQTKTINAVNGGRGSVIRWWLFENSGGAGGKLVVIGCDATYVPPLTIGGGHFTVSVYVAPDGQTFDPNRDGLSFYLYEGGDGGEGGRGSGSCGNEYLQVSVTGPYSYSRNAFYINGPGTRYEWVGPYYNNQTFQPISPGTSPNGYLVDVTWAETGEKIIYRVNVPTCSFGKLIVSR